MRRPLDTLVCGVSERAPHAPAMQERPRAVHKAPGAPGWVEALGNSNKHAMDLVEIENDPLHLHLT